MTAIIEDIIIQFCQLQTQFQNREHKFEYEMGMVKRILKERDIFYKNKNCRNQFFLKLESLLDQHESVEEYIFFSWALNEMASIS